MNRNNYPINEPIFPHWSNLGARLEAKADRQFEEEGLRLNEGRWHYYQQYQSPISKDWSRWKYMEFRYATDIDAKKRTCEWCHDKLEKQGWTEAEIVSQVVPFRKNDIVIREQVSQQDFKTLHVECAREKLESLKECFDKALEDMDEMIYKSHGDLTNSTYDSRNN